MELAAFEGDWRISRRIEDRRNGLSGRFEGRACFTPEAGGGLRYEETGTLRLGAGPPMAAARRYLWRETLRCEPWHPQHHIDGHQRHWCPHSEGQRSRPQMGGIKRLAGYRFVTVEPLARQLQRHGKDRSAMQEGQSRLGGPFLT